jgi:hypothetical protein
VVLRATLSFTPIKREVGASAWDDRAAVALGAACADQSWRVREMGVKVARRHLM